MRVLDPSAFPLDGQRLIEASAGTGKTYTISLLFIRFLLERKVPVRHILVMTFTEAATAELRSRIRNLILQTYDYLKGDSQTALDVTIRTYLDQRSERDEDLKTLYKALLDFDQAAIYTIHGFCYRILQEFALECGLDPTFQLVTDQQDYVASVVCDAWTGFRFDAHPALVHHFSEQNIGLDDLQMFAKHIIEHPKIELLPAKADPGQINWESFKCIDQRVRRCWQAHQSEVIGILSTSPALNRRKYRCTNIPKWQDLLDRNFSPNRPLFALGEASEIERFSATSLREGTKLRHEPPEHAFFTAIDAWVSEVRAIKGNLDAMVVAFFHELRERVRSELRKNKDRHSVIYFSDLLTRVHDSLCDDKCTLLDILRTRYWVALIDEFQDTDPVQFRIFELLNHSESTTVYIGDPKQAIFGFRGADIYAYLKAATKHDERWTLTTNWRSDPGLVRAVNAFFKDTTRPFIDSRIEFVEVAPRVGAKDVFMVGDAHAPAVKLHWLQAEENHTGKGIIAHAIPTVCANRVVRLLQSARIGNQALKPNDIAILVRKNVQAAAVQRALQSADIPCIVHGSESVFHTEQAYQLQLFLAGLADVGNRSLLRAAMGSELVGLRASDLMAADDASGGALRWDQRFRVLADTWRQKGFMPMFRLFMQQSDFYSRTLGYQGGERRITNYLHLLECLHQTEIGRQLGPESLLNWLSERIRSRSREDEQRIESDAPAVSIMTVHKSKGLQWPVVLCPYLWDAPSGRGRDRFNKFHDPTDGDQLKMEVFRESDNSTKLLADQERLAENMRLFYVALTRAQHRLEMLWADTREPTPLGLLLGARDSFAVYQSLCAMRSAHFAIEPLPMRQVPMKWTVPESEPEALKRRHLAEKPRRSFRVGSFTQMVQHSHGNTILPSEQDHDFDESVNRDLDGQSQIPLGEFRRGARAGVFFHKLLELIDFRATSSEIEPTVLALLDDYRLDPDWAGPVALALVDVLETEILAGSGLRLNSVPRQQRIDEMEFMFPVGEVGGRVSGLTGTKLYELFQQIPDSDPSTLESVAILGFQPLNGFMKGYIDLVFYHDGRWYLADYKSNHLGLAYEDYGQPQLKRSIRESHYYLQYHLYTLALHRYLSLRVPDYCYERNFGGVFYLYLRGMHPALGPENGVYFHRPTLETINAFSACMGVG